MERSTSSLNLLPDCGDYEKATKISEGLFSNKNIGVVRLMLKNMEICKKMARNRTQGSGRNVERCQRWDPGRRRNPK